MKALAAERAEVEQEGCKPEFRTAQREMKMIMWKKAWPLQIRGFKIGSGWS